MLRAASTAITLCGASIALAVPLSAETCEEDPAASGQYVNDVADAAPPHAAGPSSLIHRISDVLNWVRARDPEDLPQRTAPAAAASSYIPDEAAAAESISWSPVARHGGGGPAVPDDDAPPPMLSPPRWPDAVNFPEPARQDAVRRAMQHAWHGYRTFAWGLDEVDALKQTGERSFGMGLTLIDSLDTLIVMGLDTEVARGVEWIETQLSFGSQEGINLFEVTIRVLGGLLSAYEALLEPALLAKAEELGSKMLFAFHTPSGLPFGTLGLRSKKRSNPTWSRGASTVAEVATLQLEFRALSRHTGNPVYEAVAQRVMDHLRRMSHLPPPSSPSPPPSPPSRSPGEAAAAAAAAAAKPAEEKSAWPEDLPRGLYPMFISPESGEFTSQEVTLGARADSLYEYLLKQWLLSSKTDQRMRDMYETSVAAIRSHLVRSGGAARCGNCTYLAAWNHRTRQYKEQMDHLACFAPGMLALGAHGDGAAADLKLAEALMATCVRMYTDSPSGLAAEIAEFSHPTKVSPSPNARHNLLRPETSESLFILWRLTGEAKYREWGWHIFEAFERHTRVAGGGYAPVIDVSAARPRLGGGRMESFFTAETLKYLYLLFGDGSQYPLDEYVFNTEAHPLMIRPEYQWGRTWGSLPALADLAAPPAPNLTASAAEEAATVEEHARMRMQVEARAALLAGIPTVYRK
jgi:hypothetical protein